MLLKVFNRGHTGVALDSPVFQFLGKPLHLSYGFSGIAVLQKTKDETDLKLPVIKSILVLRTFHCNAENALTMQVEMNAIISLCI